MTSHLSMLLKSKGKRAEMEHENKQQCVGCGRGDLTGTIEVCLACLESCRKLRGRIVCMGPNGTIQWVNTRPVKIKEQGNQKNVLSFSAQELQIIIHALRAQEHAYYLDDGHKAIIASSLKKVESLGLAPQPC